MPGCCTGLDFRASSSNRSCLGDAGKLATAQDPREVWPPRKTTRRICRLEKSSEIGLGCLREHTAGKLFVPDHRATNTAVRLRNSDATCPGSYPPMVPDVFVADKNIEAWHRGVAV
jgi:hypothetical protein